MSHPGGGTDQGGPAELFAPDSCQGRFFVRPGTTDRGRSGAPPHMRPLRYEREYAGLAAQEVMEDEAIQ